MTYPEGWGEKKEGGVMQGGYYSKADPTPIPLPSGYSAVGVLHEPAVSQLLW